MSDINRLYLAKKNLNTYPIAQIRNFAREYGITGYTDNDLLWLVALLIHRKQRATMSSGLQNEYNQLTLGLEIETCILDCVPINSQQVFTSRQKFQSDETMHGYDNTVLYYQELAAKLEELTKLQFDVATQVGQKEYGKWLVTPDKTIQCHDPKNILYPKSRLTTDYYKSKQYVGKDCLEKPDNESYLPVEFISPVLNVASDGIGTVGHVIKTLHDNFAFNVSTTMGIHVHMSHPNLLKNKVVAFDTVAKICGWWLLFEPIVLFLTTTARLNSMVLSNIDSAGKVGQYYAKATRLAMEDNALQNTKELIAAGSRSKNIIWTLAYNKYAAFNVQNICHYWDSDCPSESPTQKPTVEFRLFHTSFEADDIQEWIRVLGCCIAIALVYSPPENIDEIFDWGNVIIRDLQQMFPERVVTETPSEPSKTGGGGIKELMRLRTARTRAEVINQGKATIDEPSQEAIEAFTNLRNYFFKLVDDSTIEKEYLRLVKKNHPLWIL
jgi:hypothetical protein